MESPRAAIIVLHAERGVTEGRMEDLRIEDAEIENTDPPWFRLRAVAVHLYTASGVVLALLILVAAFQGDAVRALWLMLASLLIDSTDGLLARRLRSEERRVGKECRSRW